MAEPGPAPQGSPGGLRAAALELKLGASRRRRAEAWRRLLLLRIRVPPGGNNSPQGLALPPKPHFCHSQPQNSYYNKKTFHAVLRTHSGVHAETSEAASLRLVQGCGIRRPAYHTRSYTSSIV